MNHLALIEDAVRSDASVWWELFGKIRDKKRQLVTPQCNFLQRKIQRVINRLRELGLPIRIMILKPRQKGSTTYCAAIDYTELRRKPTACCIIGGEFSQTDSLWSMLQCYNQNDKFGWGNNGEVNAREGKWTNGSTLKKETARDVLAAVSTTNQILHATEVARWSEYGVANAAEVLSNVLKTVPLLPDTVIILESSAEMASGDFFQRYVAAVDGEDFLNGIAEVQQGQYVRLFAPWFEFSDSSLPDHLTAEQQRLVEDTIDKIEEFHGESELISRYSVIGADGVQRLGSTVTTHTIWEQLAWRRWAITTECTRDKNKFDRDYPHSWEDAFQKSGELRFNHTGLKMQRKRVAMRVPEHGCLEDDKKTKKVVFRPTDVLEAQVILYERPASSRRYILTIDPMTGISQTGGKDPDLHGAFVLRAGYWDDRGRWTRPAVAARIVPCRWDIDILEREGWKLARFYGGMNGCKIAVEINKDRGLVELFKLRGADLYERQIFNHREQKQTGAYGWDTTPSTRERLIENMARAIREWDKDGEGFDIFDPDALTQFEHFVKKPNGRSEAALGYHDDDVLALCIGLLLIEHASTMPSDHLMRRLTPPDLREPVESGGGFSQFS